MARYSSELFPDLGKGRGTKRRFVREFRLVHERYVKLNEEKIALVILLFLGVGVCGYLLGYNIGVKKPSDAGSTESEPHPVKISNVENNTQTILQTEAFSPGENITKYRYLVQLVAYKNRDYALAEKKRLERKGYDVVIKKSGRWSIVYAGYYDRRKDAEKALKKLKEDYRDAFIKKVKGGEEDE